MSPEHVFKLIAYPIGVGALEYLSLHFEMFDLDTIVAINYMADHGGGVVLAKHIELALTVKALRNNGPEPISISMLKANYIPKPEEIEVVPSLPLVENSEPLQMQLEKSRISMEMELLEANA